MDSREDNEKWPHAVGNFFWLCRKVKCEAEDPETSKAIQVNRERKKERKAKRNKDLSQAKFQF